MDTFEEARARVPQVDDLIKVRRLLLKDAHVHLPEASDEESFLRFPDQEALPGEPIEEMENAFERENTFPTGAVEQYADLNSRSIPRDIQHRHEVEQVNQLELSRQAREEAERIQAGRRTTLRELKIGLSALVGFVALTHFLSRKSA